MAGNRGIGGPMGGGNRPGSPASIVVPATNPWWMSRQFWRNVKDYFVYARDFVTPQQIPAGGQGALPIAINGDSAFQIVSTTAVVTLTDNVTFIPNWPLLCRIEDSGSGRVISDTLIHMNNYFGTAEEPKYWDKPKLIPANSTITITLQNLDLVNAYHVRLAFHGFKVFPITE